MSKSPISTDAAPGAIGPYSQAVRAGGLVFISGQIPLDPATMAIASADFDGQIRQVMENLSAVCTAAGGSLDDVVKFTVYLTDLGNFSVVNSVMEEYLTPPYAARAAIEVSALPRDALVEVDAIMSG
ncbi:MAG: RidA family protein [Proteobacteria bacterium]|jgi:reactive intermediate/imine deaminase|nr:RidA family protein [Pseudomonadota bacterium]